MQQIKQQAIERIKQLKKSPTAQNVMAWNSFVLGIHNYFKYASQVNIDFNRISYDLARLMFNRLKQTGVYERPKKTSKTFQDYYGNGKYKTWKVAGIYLFPMFKVSNKVNLSFSQEKTLYTKTGRNLIGKKNNLAIDKEIVKLMTSTILNRTTEYMDNRLSRYSMKKGKCEILGTFLYADEVHCHHYLPVFLGGNDDFNNLRILHKNVHKLIHATNQSTIDYYLNLIKPDKSQQKRINQYRKVCNLQLI